MKVLCTLTILCALLALAFTRPSNDLTTTTEEQPGVGGLKPSQCRPVPHPVVNTTKYDMMELCQRCVRYTLNVDVFFLCCSNEEDVQIWCVQAHEYGRDPSLDDKSRKSEQDIEEYSPFKRY